MDEVVGEVAANIASGFCFAVTRLGGVTVAVVGAVVGAVTGMVAGAVAGRCAVSAAVIGESWARLRSWW